MVELLSNWVDFIWGKPVLYLCLGAGIFYTLRLKFIQLRCFKHAIKLLKGDHDHDNEHGEITHFQALCAALSGTIGIGNMAGVAIAIGVGGPGAVFWMWVIAFFGMAAKYAECTLGTYYREVNPETEVVHGGPMYYITKGLGEKWKPLAIIYGACLALGTFGVGGMFQSNQAAAAVYTQFGIPPFFTGVLLAGLVGLVIIGGIKRIGAVASKIVPVMCVIYLIGAITICIMNASLIPLVMKLILSDAFTGMAAAGGVLGVVIKTGVQRAVFSNEAGLGSASIAHAAVKTNYPVREGVVASLGPLIDTIIVCSATAFVIILSGQFGLHRYDNPTQQVISFEGNNFRTNANWTLETGPQNTNKLNTYKTGELALGYSNTQTATNSSPRISLSALLNDQETVNNIRFNTYIEKGTYDVNILSDSGAVLLSLNSASKQLKGLNRPGEWHSRIIPVSNELEKTLKDNPNASLQIVTKGAETFYLDTIEAVTPLSGINLTTSAFDKFFPGFGPLLITIGAFFFAYSTMITWSYYGEVGAFYIFGKKINLPYKLTFVVITFYGTIISLDSVLLFSDLLIGILVIPNAIALLLLSGKVAKETKIYFDLLKSGKFDAPSPNNSKQQKQKEPVTA